MPAFGTTSLRKLSECDERLQIILHDVVQEYDISVICGHREESAQNELFRAGKSHVLFPNSKHNVSPSRAVDIIPWPVDWNDREAFCYMAGFVFGVAASHDIRLRWGGNWDGDGRTANHFDDLPHFELLDA